MGREEVFFGGVTVGRLADRLGGFRRVQPNPKVVGCGGKKWILALPSAPPRLGWHSIVRRSSSSNLWGPLQRSVCCADSEGTFHDTFRAEKSVRH